MNRILRKLFFLILIIFPFGQLFRLSLTALIPGLRFHLFEISIFIFILFWFFRKVKLKEKFLLPAFFKPMVIFGALAAFSLFLKIGHLKPVEFLGALFYLIRYFNLIFLYWAMVDFFKKEHLDLKKYLVRIGLAVAVFSLIQYIILPDTRFLFNFGWDEHYFRAIGPFLDPAFTGIILCLSFIAFVMNFFEGEKSFSILLKGTLLLLALGLTFSRLAYVCLLFGMGMILIFKKKMKALIIFIFVFLFLILLLPKPGGEGVNLLRTSSFIAREENYQQTLEIIKNNLFFGVGFNAFRYTQRDYGFLSFKNWQETNAGAGADNSLLFALATTGIFGLLAFLWWWSKIIISCFKVALRNGSSLMLLSSVVTVLLSSIFINSLFYPWIVFWLFLLLARFTVEKEASIPVRPYSGRDRSKQF